MRILFPKSIGPDLESALKGLVEAHSPECLPATVGQVTLGSEQPDRIRMEAGGWNDRIKLDFLASALSVIADQNGILRDIRTLEAGTKATHNMAIAARALDNTWDCEAAYAVAEEKAPGLYSLTVQIPADLLQDILDQPEQFGIADVNINHEI